MCLFRRCHVWCHKNKGVVSVFHTSITKRQYERTPGRQRRAQCNNTIVSNIYIFWCEFCLINTRPINRRHDSIFSCYYICYFAMTKPVYCSRTKLFTSIFMLPTVCRLNFAGPSIHRGKYHTHFIC